MAFLFSPGLLLTDYDESQEKDTYLSASRDIIRTRSSFLFDCQASLVFSLRPRKLFEACVLERNYESLITRMCLVETSCKVSRMFYFMSGMSSVFFLIIWKNIAGYFSFLTPMFNLNPEYPFLIIVLQTVSQTYFQTCFSLGSPGDFVQPTI